MPAGRRQRTATILQAGAEGHAIGLAHAGRTSGRDRDRRLHRAAAIDARPHAVEALVHDLAEIAGAHERGSRSRSRQN
jgi:hypothetical protein